MRLPYIGLSMSFHVVSGESAAICGPWFKYPAGILLGCSAAFGSPHSSYYDPIPSLMTIPSQPHPGGSRTPSYACRLWDLMLPTAS